MPRLGVPANIHFVGAFFRQPRSGTGNLLALRFAQPVPVRLERVAIGAKRWAAYWEGAPETLTRKDALIPLAVAVTKLFEEQITDWRAFDYQGQRQEEIDGEIRRQLQEWVRRHPKSGPSPANPDARTRQVAAERAG
jgi:hypothetical protein